MKGPRTVYAIIPLLQEVVAQGFELEMSRLDSAATCYFHTLSAELKEKRDHMCSALPDAGLQPVLPQGSYFMMCDYSKIGERYHIISRPITVYQ